MAQFEVLSRRADGHETVTRVDGKTKEAAIKAVVELGIPRDQVVEARKS